MTVTAVPRAVASPLVDNSCKPKQNIFQIIISFIVGIFKSIFGR
jgi:hypothetical protein